MKLALVRACTRSACFELQNNTCYAAPAPFRVQLNGQTVLEACCTNVFSVFSLEPGKTYHLEVLATDGDTGTLDFATAAESFFVDASRYGLVNDGVTDNTAFLQAALSTCPPGGTVYVPAGTYRTQSLFLCSNTTLYLEKAAPCWAAPTAANIPSCLVCCPAPMNSTKPISAAGRETRWTALPV